MLEFALRYAALGWFILPLHSIRFDGRCGCGKPDCASPGKHPRIKWKAGASCDPETVREYWTRWPTAGIGLATGPSGLVVADADSVRGVETFRALLAGGACSPTARARTARGVHVFFRGVGGTRGVPETKLDTRGVGGYVVLPPSPHVSGHVYSWIASPWDVAIAEAPAALIAYSQEKRRGALGEGRVGGIRTAPWLTPTEAPTGNGASADFTMRLGSCLVDWREVDRALACIPPDVGYDQWVHVGMALHAAGDNGARWDQWSSRGEKYKEGETGQKWISFKQVPDGIGLGSLFVIAQEYGYGRDIGENTGPSLVAPIASKEMNGHNILNDSSLALPESFNASPIWFPDVTEGGKVKATCANAIEATRVLGITCEFDEFHERSKVGGQIMSQWAGDLSDNIVHRVRVLVRERFGFDPGSVHMRDALVQECLCHPFHPIKDYFKSLQWDGIPRLETWMIRYLGAVDDAFNREVGRLSLIAAVRRILQPGCKFDQIVVFDAKEGVGKSSAIRILAGDDNFSDQEILTLSEVRQQEALQGKWLYEIADKQGHSAADVDKVKAFASRTVDRARPAYGHFRVDRPRTCIFFATTNEAIYLLSQTGNRRFWSIVCGLCDLEGLERDRDQIWAEAILKERGTSLVLPEHLWGEAAKRQEARRQHDPWEDLLANLEKTKHVTLFEEREYRIWSRDIMGAAILDLPTAQQSNFMTKRIARIMRRFGWDGPKDIAINKAVYKGYTLPRMTRP